MCSPQSRQDFINNAVGSVYFPKKDDPRKLVDLIFATKVLKYLKQEGEKQKKKQKKAGAGELFASLTPAKLAQN